MKVLIVDDDSAFIDKLIIALQTDKNFDVVGTAVNGQEAFLKCSEDKPELVLMDLRMPVADGVKGTELIKSCYKDIRVLIMTAFKDDRLVEEAIDKGAEDFILKNLTTDEIVESIKNFI